MMRDDELDLIFSDEGAIEPSPGFAASVMDAVRREASTPPPIPFPWVCALPLLAAWAMIPVLIVIKGFGTADTSPSMLARLLSSVTTLLRVGMETGEMLGAGWIILALLLALASLGLSLRLTRGNA